MSSGNCLLSWYEPCIGSSNWICFLYWEQLGSHAVCTCHQSGLNLKRRTLKVRYSWIRSMIFLFSLIFELGEVDVFDLKQVPLWSIKRRCQFCHEMLFYSYETGIYHALKLVTELCVNVNQNKLPSQLEFINSAVSTIIYSARLGTYCKTLW